MNLQNKRKINSHYSKLLNYYGYNKFGMGWRNDQLEKRYQVFLKYMDLNNKVILDYGSGICDLYYFLLKKKIRFKKYIGYDFNPDLILFNQKKKLKKFKFVNRKTKIELSKIDFTISNGVHNFKTNSNFDDFKKDLNFLFNISRIGFGISFLNNNVDYKENYLSYLSIKKVIDEIQKFNCSYIIDQTFKKYETFLIMHKK